MATEVNSFARSSRFIKLGADLGRGSRPPAPRSQHIVEFYQACCPALPMAAYKSHRDKRASERASMAAYKSHRERASERASERAREREREREREADALAGRERDTYRASKASACTSTLRSRGTRRRNNTIAPGNARAKDTPAPARPGMRDTLAPALPGTIVGFSKPTEILSDKGLREGDGRLPQRGAAERP